MNKYLQSLLLRWIRLEKKLTKNKDKLKRLRELELGIENINRPYTTQPLQSKWVNEKNIEHYVPIDWAQRRIDFLNTPVPEESQAWADMGREEFLDTANPLTENEQAWADMDVALFYEALEEDNG